MTRFYIVAKVPVMLQYEKAAVSNSAFKGDVVYYYDVKERERGREREMSGEQNRERLFYYNKSDVRGDEFASQRNGPVNETLPQLTISPPALKPPL